MTTSASSSAPFAPSPRVPAESRRHLRVGIVQGGRIVEERVFRAGETITLGPRAADTFIVPPDVLARPWRLFEERGGRLALRLAPEMTARLAAGGELSAWDAAPGEPLRAIVLPDGARGKVTLGDTTVLFQRIRPPAPRPRPQLPASVRRQVLADLDLPFVGLASLAFLLHLAMVIYLRQVDWPRRPVIDELPDRFLHEIARRPRPAAPVAARPEPKPGAPSRAKPRPHAVEAAPAKPEPKPVESDAERRARLEREVQKMGVVALITAKADGASAAQDLLGPGGVEQSVEEALKGVGGLTVAGEGSLRLPRLGAGTGKVATPTPLPSGVSIARAKIDGVVERAIKTDVREGPPSVEDGHVDAAAIAREIRGRRKAIAACYERALKQRPTLAGKLVVRFSLTAAGTVSAADVDDDTLGAPDVAACIRAVVLHWRFPPLAEGPAELSFPFVFQPGE
jgi:outer membrane biosynthesis protein TonB